MDKKILIVDDEAPIRDMLSHRFARDGFDVATAATAEEALEILESQNIHVMFLDLKLPGMNGVELCRAVREKNPIACIYAVTGYQTLFELAECRMAGFDDYFTKPVKLERLLKAADEAFEKLDRWTSREEIRN